MTTVTSTERPTSLAERLDPRNWNLVAKLAIVGLVPIVLLLSIGAIRVVELANVAEELNRGGAMVDVHHQVEALTGALQAERNASVAFVGGNRQGDRPAVERAQASTDLALREVDGRLNAAEEQAPQLGTALRQAETTFGQLPVIRSQVLESPTPPSDVTSRYTSVIQRTLALDRAVVGRLQTADTASLATALAAGLNAREALELERTVVNGAIAANQLDESGRAQLAGAEVAFDTAAGDFQASAASAEPGTVGTVIANPAVDERNTLRSQVLSSPSRGPIRVDPAAWNATADRSVHNATEAVTGVERGLVASRSAAAEQAGNKAGLNSVLLMLALLVTGGIILLLGRQMVRSLRLLRSSALEVAERKLPAAVASMRSGQAPEALVDPVPLDSRDEIGEVARAFDAVHGQAIRLAADQAALQQNVNSMFVNLSRRSQALVERQLQLIEQLESNEQDPDQLSNLFQLDHLATRMRRNSENLLVLAGTDLAKRNVAPVQVVDVLRAAVSEVEQYQRVIVQTPPNATIAGRSANDLVHLLAELLDNATNFSPPDSQVVMSTIRTADESLLIEISDRGVGMSDAELVDANQRLSGPAEVDVSVSRRMGLFVVGRLAARHHVGVRLVSGAVGGGSGGLSASVTVPPHLVPSAQLPEQRRDGGPAGGPPALPPQEPAPALTAAPVISDPSVPSVPSVGSSAPQSAVNGSGRSASLPSLVAGSDGPLTPTFEAGATKSGNSRNGSSSALPTRKPGSALRKNAPNLADETVNGQEAAANGFASRGAQAFAPSPEGTSQEKLTSADFFTPMGKQPGSGSSGSSLGSFRRSGGLPPRGPDAFRGGPGTTEPADDGAPGAGDAHEADGPGDDDTTAFAATPAEPADDTSTTDRPTRSGGVAAIFGLGAAAAAARARGDAEADGPAERELDDTVVFDRAVDDGPPPTGPRADAEPEDPADDEAPSYEDTDLTPPATDEAGPGAIESWLGDAGSSEPDSRDGADDAGTLQEADPWTGSDEGESAEAESSDTTTGGSTTADAPLPDDTTSDGRTDGDDAADTGAAAIGTEVETDEADQAGETADRSDLAGAGAESGISSDGAGSDLADLSSTAGPPEQPDDDDHGSRSAPPVAGAVGAVALSDDQDDIPEHDGGAERDGDVDPATAAMPTIRSSGREPMGGPPASRSGQIRPTPDRRPVMPGGRIPQSPLPTRRPDQSPDQTGLPQRTPAPQEASSADAPTPNSLAGGSVLPRRQPGRTKQGGPAGVLGGPSAPGTGQDELFAPKVPVEGDRGQLRRPGALESSRIQGPGSGFDMEQTTPIFDDIASAWFRSNRSVPVRWQDGAPAQAGGPATDRPDAGAAPANGSGRDAGFASPADEAWRHAREVASEQGDGHPDDLTIAGLPKRRPRARLLPGSAAGSTLLSPAPVGESRNAESVRGRLASYQQGVRQGRESAAGRQNTTRHDADTSPDQSAGPTNESDPEEHQ